MAFTNWKKIKQIKNAHGDTPQCTLEAPYPSSESKNDNVNPESQSDFCSQPVDIPSTNPSPKNHSTNITPNITPASDFVVDCHDMEWHLDYEKAKSNQNGLLHHHEWFIRTPYNEHLHPGCQSGKLLSQYDFFLLMLPPKQLTDMTELTNVELYKNVEERTTQGEILKLFGIMILMTRVEFTSRRNLWSNTPISKYIPAPSFGKTGMTRNRFDVLWRYFKWSYQPDSRPLGMSDSAYRWMLVDDFISHFNDHRVHCINPSEMLCVDEYMFRWYGIGGDWINKGLPIYIAIDRKPENGAEVQDS